MVPALIKIIKEEGGAGMVVVDQRQKIYIAEGQRGRLNVSLEQALNPYCQVHVYLDNWLDAAESDRKAAAKVELQRVLGGVVDDPSPGILVDVNEPGSHTITLQQHMGSDYFSLVVNVGGPAQSDDETRALLKNILLDILDDLATTRSRADLEEMARDAIRRTAGCAHVIDVELLYVEMNARRPNWRLVGTTPPLPAAALHEAASVIEKLAEHYLMVDD